jgi:hypothetical protein
LCEIGASGWQGIDEKKSIADRHCWNMEKAQYIDFHSQQGYLISKIFEEEWLKEALQASMDFPNEVIRTLKELIFRKKVAQLLLKQIL